MSTPVSSLPENWVERIWSTMRATYGAAFDRQWECPAGVDPVQHVSDLKAVWGRELRGFQQNPRAIAHALDHLPADHPPNLLQFAALCRRTPQVHQAELPPPKASQAVIAQVLDAVRPPKRNPRAWMQHVQRRIASGERVSIAVRDMLATAEKASPSGIDL
jgi:hypothetical protein